jgi:hypothetical protein
MKNKLKLVLLCAAITFTGLPMNVGAQSGDDVYDGSIIDEARLSPQMAARAFALKTPAWSQVRLVGSTVLSNGIFVPSITIDKLIRESDGAIVALSVNGVAIPLSQVIGSLDEVGVDFIAGAAVSVYSYTARGELAGTSSYVSNYLNLGEILSPSLIPALQEYEVGNIDPSEENLTGQIFGLGFGWGSQWEGDTIIASIPPIFDSFDYRFTRPDGSVVKQGTLVPFEDSRHRTRYNPVLDVENIVVPPARLAPEDRRFELRYVASVQNLDLNVPKGTWVSKENMQFNSTLHLPTGDQASIVMFTDVGRDGIEIELTGKAVVLVQQVAGHGEAKPVELITYQTGAGVGLKTHAFSKSKNLRNVVITLLPVWEGDGPIWNFIPELRAARWQKKPQVPRASKAPRS